MVSMFSRTTTDIEVRTNERTATPNLFRYSSCSTRIGRNHGTSSLEDSPGFGEPLARSNKVFGTLTDRQIDTIIERQGEK